MQWIQFPRVLYTCRLLIKYSNLKKIKNVNNCRWQEKCLQWLIESCTFSSALWNRKSYDWNHVLPGTFEDEISFFQRIMGPSALHSEVSLKKPQRWVTLRFALWIKLWKWPQSRENIWMQANCVFENTRSFEKWNFHVNSLFVTSNLVGLQWYFPTLVWGGEALS